MNLLDMGVCYSGDSDTQKHHSKFIFALLCYDTEDDDGATFYLTTEIIM